VELKQCEDILQQGLAALGISAGHTHLTALCCYQQELLKWSRKMNLVAATPEEEILENHFLDSLTLLPLIPDSEDMSLMDVGSGAGFPGLVLKICCPDLRVTLIEPRQKRISFLKHIIRTLGLKKVDTLSLRLDNKTILPELAGKYEIVTSRAFASIGDFLALVAPYVKPDGKVICMKGPAAPEEVSQWRVMNDPVFRLVAIHPAALPFSRKTRNLVEFSKY